MHYEINVLCVNLNATCQNLNIQQFFLLVKSQKKASYVQVFFFSFSHETWLHLLFNGFEITPTKVVWTKIAVIGANTCMLYACLVRLFSEQ